MNVISVQEVGHSAVECGVQLYFVVRQQLRRQRRVDRKTYRTISCRMPDSEHYDPPSLDQTSTDPRSST